MINLPDNWRDAIRVIPGTHLLLAYVNGNREFFLYVMPLDKAYTLEQMLDRLAESYPTGRAHTIDTDLAVNWLDAPTDQDWLPMPVIDARVMSLEQYKASARLSANEVTEGGEVPQ